MAENDEHEDPLGELLRRLSADGQLPPELANLPGMPSDPAALQQMMAQVQQMLAGAGEDPVNWTLAHDLARSTASAEGDPSIGEREQRVVAEALRTADLWLDRVVDFEGTGARTQAWSRAEWIENTFETWRSIMAPVASSVSTALTETLAQQAPEEVAGAMASALPLFRRMAGAFFGVQVGQALGGLAREVVGAGDVGVPLLTDGRTALLPSAVSAFAEGLELPEDEVRLYLALREVAHARLFAAVPWLRAHVLAAVEEYARGVEIDLQALEEKVRGLDVSDPAGLQQALASGLFEPEPTPAQRAAQERFEIVLALVEGWVDDVVHTAAVSALPHAEPLREAVRRRRAVGGPAEHTMAQLVGLQLRPRRLREAAAVWRAVTDRSGIAVRDGLWLHPDLVPTAAAFADPAGFALAVSGADEGDAMDAALAQLLDDEAAGGAGDGSDDGPRG